MSMNSSVNDINTTASVKQPIFYGWVIVASCFLLLTIQVAIQYGFSVFFKPLAADFGWSRTATSGAYSVLMIAAGITAIPLGWLGDRFGPSKVLVGCSFIIGLSLVLTSRVTELWQFYLTFGVLQGLGMGGSFAISTGLTSRWFVKKRGLAMGFVSAGVGVGTLLGPPISERLINAFGWSSSYMFIGFTAWVTMIGLPFFYDVILREWAYCLMALIRHHPSLVPRMRNNLAGQPASIWVLRFVPGNCGC